MQIPRRVLQDSIFIYVILMLLSELIQELQKAVAQWYDKNVIRANNDWSKWGNIVEVELAENTETWDPSDVVIVCE